MERYEAEVKRNGEGAERENTGRKERERERERKRREEKRRDERDSRRVEGRWMVEGAKGGKEKEVKGAFAKATEAGRPGRFGPVGTRWWPAALIANVLDRVKMRLFPNKFLRNGSLRCN